MFKIMNIQNHYQVSKKENLQETKLLKEKPDNDNIALADYKTGQAVLAQRAVNFKKQYKLASAQSENFDNFKPNKTKTIIYKPLDKDLAMKTLYPYKADSLKDDIVAFYTSCLLFLYRAPYITTDATAGKIDEFKDDLNNKDISYVSLPLTIINNPKNNSKYNCEETRILHDGMIYTILDEKLLGNTLESLKETRKQKLKDIYSRSNDDEYKKSYIHKYGEDPSKIYEIIDNITFDDIKEFIKTYLINQEPITIINSNIFPNGDIRGKYDAN